MACLEPRTGLNCSSTFADTAGITAFLSYRIMFLVLGIVLGIGTVLETWLFSKAKRQLRLQMQQSYELSVYQRLIMLSVVFVLYTIDPLGYADILGSDGWLIISGISTFLLLSVCISLIFNVVRGIALVGQKHALLAYFNRLYIISQALLFFSWMILPIVQAIVQMAYLVEALKLTLSSVVFLLWTVGSLSYGKMAIKNLQELSNEIEEQGLQASAKTQSDVYIQRVSILKMSNRILLYFSLISIIFVIVQFVNVYQAINLKSEVNFDVDLSAPSNFADLFISGLFEFVKIIFSYTIFIGICYLRRSRNTNSIMTESGSHQDLYLTEMQRSGIDPKDAVEAEEEEDQSPRNSQSSMFDSTEDLAAA
jgi:hypothetical protein